MQLYRKISGDVTSPIFDTPLAIIPHCCNDLGVMGAGVAFAIRKKWPKAFELYKRWYQEGHYQKPGQTNLTPFRLGEIQAVKVAPDIAVINMIGQAGIRGASNRPPIRYGSLAWAMLTVKQVAVKHQASIHCPMFGSALAGGNWDVIEQMIFEHWTDYDIPVTVYEYP